MSALPHVLTHTYNPVPGPFLNLCALDDASAEHILDTMRRDHGRCGGKSYLARRRATEAWLRRERRRKGIVGALEQPIYFFLGDYDDGLDPARPAAIVVPLSLFPERTLSLTWRDSMDCFEAVQSGALDDPAARLHTLGEMKQILAATGTGLAFGRAISVGRAASTLAPARRGFIEVQVWCDAPLRSYRDRIAKGALGG